MKHLFYWLIILGLAYLLTSCSQNQTNNLEQTTLTNESPILHLPELSALDLKGEKLQVVTTTSIIGDVVSQVGGDAIVLTTLIKPGQDPHSYEPAAQDLTAVSQADIIFINGWDLEENLVHNLEEIGEGVPIVAISANITPHIFAENNHEANHNNIDPHVWLNIANVEQWTKNGASILSDLDPAHAETYQENANLYLAELKSLAEYSESQLAQIPEADRYLVTNHDALGYFAEAYNFTILGTIIPNLSSSAEPSAVNLAHLITEMEAYGICTIFTETSTPDSLAQTIASDLDDCDQVKILQLYVGAVGATENNSYIDMFRDNIDVIIEGLKQG